MCVGPQNERKLSSFHLKKHVLIAPGIEESFITVPFFGFCEVSFPNSTKFISWYSSKDGMWDGSVGMLTNWLTHKLDIMVRIY